MTAVPVLDAGFSSLKADAFAGGIGENDAAICAAIGQGPGWIEAHVDSAANAAGAADIHSHHGRVAIRLVPAREERQIAQEALQVMADEGLP